MTMSSFWRSISTSANILVAGMILVALTGCAPIESLNKTTNAGSHKSLKKNAFGESAVAGPVRFNMHWLERRWGAVEQGAKESDQAHASQLLLGCQDSPVGESGTLKVDLDDPRSVLLHVLYHTPQTAIVYPTEQYFYFRFSLADQEISGNLRFTDSEDNIIHLGYFVVGEVRDHRYQRFTADDGLRMVTDESGVISVTFSGISRSFILNTGPFDRPATPQPEQGSRLVHISGILDESGYELDLLFDNQTKTFFYQLQHSAPLPEPLLLVDSVSMTSDLKDTLESLSPYRVLVGKDSGFAFLLTPEKRVVLVGVFEPNIRLNNEFDGPFDQLPPRLPIQRYLHAAYPYTAMGRGIDEHGNFRDFDGSRVAISPYFGYNSLADLLGHLSESVDGDANGVDGFIRANYESKRDFHLRVRNRPIQPLAAPEHSDEISHTWPADHWPTVSRESGP